MKIKLFHKTTGQASVEYLVICAALLAALLWPWEGDTSPIEMCVQALIDWYEAFSYHKSLSILPG
ncbi:hypothetical protein L2725_08650 [Shewanella corallii]|uniref:Uncharacterized protein n=1 Tax=Shewanella corallii TaxID=560080 RepID=A0ABT0N7M4_9GAMM|nr:hypothetical protein [Shewanella corallii]MCL2913861.1 hypothetical protein [Shewanella corallii]